MMDALAGKIKAAQKGAAREDQRNNYGFFGVVVPAGLGAAGLGAEAAGFAAGAPETGFSAL